MRTIFFILLFPLLLSLMECNRPYHMRKATLRVRTGLERFISIYARPYIGKKVILVTNHSGVDYRLRQNISLFQEKGITVNLVLAPEHGLYGYQNEYDTRKKLQNTDFGVEVLNMHKLSLDELKTILRGQYAVFFDIQDMGMRCYTYISNLKFVMDALKGSDTELVVLDRPNPIGFLGTDGAYLEKEYRSRFVSAFPAPFIYDLTMGEAARYYKGEFAEQVNLRIIDMMYYERSMSFHETGLPWVPPSPNLPTYESALVYTSMVLLEGVNLSLGRGTTKPFEYIGAPWIDPQKASRDLNHLLGDHFRFRPVYFKPTFSKYSGQVCRGVQVFYRGGAFSPTKVSYTILRYLTDNYRQLRWEVRGGKYSIDFLAGTGRLRQSLLEDKPWDEFLESIENKVKEYDRRAERYRVYP